MYDGENIIYELLPYSTSNQVLSAFKSGTNASYWRNVKFVNGKMSVDAGSQRSSTGTVYAQDAWEMVPLKIWRINKNKYLYE